MLHGRTNHEIWENETSVWQLEASTGSGDINGAIKRILSKLPNDFPERLQKLPKSHVSLSIAVVQSGRFQCLKLANGNLAKTQSYWCLAANTVVLTEAILQVERAPFLNGPLWTNVAVASAGVTNGGGLIVPDDRQTLVYDLDGNLAFDGTWSYEWDGENRLKVMTMTNVATIPNPQRKRLEFGYDHMNRRISKVVKTWNGSSFTSPVTNLFVYDGWTELNTLHSSLCTYLWGSGSEWHDGRSGGSRRVADGGAAGFA